MNWWVGNMGDAETIAEAGMGLLFNKEEEGTASPFNKASESMQGSDQGR